MENNDWTYRAKKIELINAAKDALDILIEALKEPIDLDKLQDDKVRAAIQAKKIALLDAVEFLREIQSLEESIGVDTQEGVNIDVKEEWGGGFAERKAQK